MMQWRFSVVMAVCLWNISNLMGQNIPKCSEIFFSEYVEGSRNNKALEIYNPTNETVNLTQYRIVRWSNGSTQFSSALSHKLKGLLPSRKTIVFLEGSNPFNLWLKADENWVDPFDHLTIRY
jgi:predicted extracellular nuclease